MYYCPYKRKALKLSSVITPFMIIAQKLYLLDSDMYKVYDSLGNFMRKFPTYKQAVTYRLAYGNKHWYIK